MDGPVVDDGSGEEELPDFLVRTNRSGGLHSKKSWSRAVCFTSSIASTLLPATCYYTTPLPSELPSENHFPGFTVDHATPNEEPELQPTEPAI